MRFFGILPLFCCLAVPAFSQVERPLVAVPFDPLEMATGAIQVMDTPEKRDAASLLVSKAHQSFSLQSHREPFDLKVSFNASGPWMNQGAGEMEEVWLSQAQWRWTARVGAYSQVRIGTQPELAYDEQPADMIPFPLQMIRNALFSGIQGNTNTEKLRMTASTWNGATVACVLMTAAGNPVSRAPGRLWPEREYCVSPASGLLQIASVAPGYYVAYDYSNAIRFHTQVIPGKITISENGHTVLEARIESVTDPATPNPALFNPTPQMLARGPAPVMTISERFFRFQAIATADPSGLIQPTIVHALIDQAGNVKEAVALQSTSVSAAATEFVKRSNFAQPAAPGRASIQREAFINVQFDPVTPLPAPRPGKPAIR